jgi:hypothetical protein
MGKNNVTSLTGVKPNSDWKRGTGKAEPGTVIKGNSYARKGTVSTTKAEAISIPQFPLKSKLTKGQMGAAIKGGKYEWT